MAAATAMATDPSVIMPGRYGAGIWRPGSNFAGLWIWLDELPDVRDPVPDVAGASRGHATLWGVCPSLRAENDLRLVIATRLLFAGTDQSGKMPSCPRPGFEEKPGFPRIPPGQGCLRT